MKAYILKAPKVILTEDRPLGVCAGDEVLIKVSYVGICGSDIHLFKGTYNGPHTYPMLFGHEWSGTVESVGAEIKDLMVGDKVTGDCSRYCGDCEHCQTDKNLCAHIEKFGITIDGATAQYIIRKRKYVYKAPSGVDLSHLALAEPISVARHLIGRVNRLADGFAGKSILIYGGGVIGQAALLLLRQELGIEKVDLFDLVAARTKLAAALGARIPAPDELQVKEGADYASIYQQARYDIILETTGVAPVFANALSLLRPGGTLGCVGMIAKAEIAQKQIVTKALTVAGSIGGTGEFPEVIRFIAAHSDLAERLISHRFAMEDAAQAFAVAVDAGQSMKVMLKL